jgi:hypothetical protein
MIMTLRDTVSVGVLSRMCGEMLVMFVTSVGLVIMHILRKWNVLSVTYAVVRKWKESCQTKGVLSAMYTAGTFLSVSLMERKCVVTAMMSYMWKQS